MIPLEEIKDAKHKVVCIDKEGYKYLLNYHTGVGDKRTKSFNKWSKNNPFKSYNMRLYASKIQDNVKILSTDEELREASVKKVKFICPNCGEIYEKKWCHWIGQPINKHFCPKCSYRNQGDSLMLTYSQIENRFKAIGLRLLSKYDEYKDNHSNLYCEDENGYRYYVNVTEITSGNFKKYNKFSMTNPNAKYNLQHWCDLNNISVKVIDVKPRKTELSTFQCSCGNIFQTKIGSFVNGKRRCNKCVAADSKYSLLTKEWLNEHNIQYKKEYRFSDCRYKKPLPFDYQINWNGNMILIEVDGGHHFYVTQWTTGQDLEEQKIKDKIKNEYCKSHGYTLVRIPYWLYLTDTYKSILNKTFFG